MAKIAPEFASLLKQAPSTFNRPVSIPAGIYHATMGKQSFGTNRFDSKVQTIRYEININQADDSIDASLLVDAEGKPLDFAKVRLNKDFDILADKMYIFNDFCESLGLDPSKPTEELIPEVCGATVLVEVTAKASEDGKDFFNNVRKVVGA